MLVQPRPRTNDGFQRACTSGNPAFGEYDAFCTNNHRYAVYYVGQKKTTSSSSWEGSSAWGYW